MGDLSKIAETLKLAKDALRMIVKAEKTSVGRVNLLAMFFVGVAGIVRGELFTPSGIVVIVALIISAIISQFGGRYRGRKVK